MNKVLLLVTLLCVVGTARAADAFGTYRRLFGAQSLWNSKPVNPVFAENVSIPTDDSRPSITSGAFSVGVFLARASDPPMTVYGYGTDGINNVDGLEQVPSFTLPHWPKDTVPATGSDGHCDIVDETTGMVHSLYKLKFDNVTNCWNSTQYAWDYLSGTGWGDPAHWYKGARAAGVPTSAGLIRIHEAIDGEPMFYHALAMSLTYSGLGANPAYVYPATNADSHAAARNKGKIPEGALVMLPSTFNTSAITSSANLRKVCETLKTYGAYVVDQNDGTPYVIYVENGAVFPLSNMTTWDNHLTNELHQIRAALRMVASQDYFLDGNGNKLAQPYPNQNLLSMRGSTSAWTLTGSSTAGDATCRYDTWTQSLVFENSNNKSTTRQNWSHRNLNIVSWARMKADTNYTFRVESTANITLRLVLQTSVGAAVSLSLGNNQSATFIYYNTSLSDIFYVTKPAGGPGSVRGFIYETAFYDPTIITTTGSASSTGSSTVSSTVSSSSTSSSLPDEDSNSSSKIFVLPSLIMIVILFFVL